MGFLWIFKPLLVRACLPSKLKIFRSLVGKSYPKVDFIFPITELLTIGKIELFTCLLFSRWAVIKKQELYIGTMQSRSFFFILLLLYTFYYPPTVCFLHGRQIPKLLLLGREDLGDTTMKIISKMIIHYSKRKTNGFQSIALKV